MYKRSLYKPILSSIQVFRPHHNQRAMEVAPPVNPTDFNFSSSAYGNTPPTPRRMSGDNITELYREFDELLITDDTRGTNSPATVPFAWEDKPGVPKSSNNNEDFAFDVSGEFNAHSSVSAEDLFHGGMIKPLEYDPHRGRERHPSGLQTSRSRRTRSLPPFRGLEQQPPVPENTTPSTALLASGSGKGSKKWSFKDLFLFRSASDGRALDRDPLKKYSILRKGGEDVRNLSLRDKSGSKRKGRVSAHELHYTVNRAVSNDMKKKTFLPYKQGILGRLAFNPTVHALANGFGFSHNS